MIFRPDIKPPMWGPPDAVQYAVRSNAERLGINTADIGTLLALWDGGGDALWSPFGYQGSRNGAAWSNGGLVTTSAEGLVDAYSSPDQSKLAVAIGFTAYSSRKQGLFSKATSATRGITCGTFNSGDYIRAYIASTAASLRSNLIPVVGRHYNMVLVYDGSLANDQRIKFFVDGQNVGLSSVSGTIPTTLGEGDAAAAQIGRTSFFEAYSWLRWDGLISHFYILEGSVPDALAGNISATPYALLMPVARPVYFDLGASGNTDSSADSGNIAISGSAATGVKASVSSADSGTVSIAGSVASGIRSLVSIAAAASIAIAGFSAEGVYTPTGSTVSSAGPGSVAISGSPADGVQTHISSAEPGTIAILGSDANAATGYATTAEPGTVAITGADATTSRTYVTTASPTSIAIAGSPAYATKSGGSSTSSGISLIFGKVILHL